MYICILGGPKKAKPSSLPQLHKRDLRNIFVLGRGTRTASPSSSELATAHESIALQDPVTNAEIDTNATPTRYTPLTDDDVEGGSSKKKKSKLLHTIKIYLHGKSSSNKSSAVSINETIDRGNPIPQEYNNSPDNNNEAHRQNHYQFANDRDRWSKSVLLDQAANSSVSFIRHRGSTDNSNLALVSPNFRQAENKATTKSISSGTEIPVKTAPRSMSCHWKASEEDRENSSPIVDLDSEFREVLQFNIGQAVRPLAPRGLLRHVTSIESDNGEEEAEEEETGGSKNYLFAEQQQSRGESDEKDQQQSQCVSSDNGHQAKRSMRLIPSHNLQDKLTGGDKNDDDGDVVAASTTVSDLNEFQSLLDSCSGAGKQGGPGDATGIIEMPAHGDLYICTEESNTVVHFVLLGLTVALLVNSNANLTALCDSFQQSSTMSSGQGKKEHLYKILVIGELGTGKTSFIKRLVHQFFSNNYRATIGVDFALKVIPWDETTLIRLQLWDIAGQERFGNMTR